MYATLPHVLVEWLQSVEATRCDRPKSPTWGHVHQATGVQSVELLVSGMQRLQQKQHGASSGQKH